MIITSIMNRNVAKLLNLIKIMEETELPIPIADWTI